MEQPSEGKPPTTDENPEEEKLQLDLPSNTNELVDPENSVATTKEEEWVTKKKIELTTTRQIETRVKRQVVLEDGKIVEDTGPVVTTNTTEDTQKQEHSQTEHRSIGDDDSKTEWTPVSDAGDRVKQIQEKTVKSREEREERTETEDVQHLGDMSDEGYMAAIKAGSDVRQALQVSGVKDLAETVPKIVHRSMKTRKCVDSEDKTELSRIRPGGTIINETKTTRLHEELNDCDVSDDDTSSKSDYYETTKKENSQKYYKTREQDLTEYLANGHKIGERINFQMERTEGEKQGDDFGQNDEDTISLKLKRIRMRSQKNKPALKTEWTNDENVPPPKRSSTFEEEEETRKEETFKWLEHHFGSESTKSSKASLHDFDDVIPSSQNSFINVTMKSQLNKPNQNNYEPQVPKYSAGKNREFSPPPKTEYFRGIDSWSSRRTEEYPAAPDRVTPPRVEMVTRVRPLGQSIVRSPGTPTYEGDSAVREGALTPEVHLPHSNSSRFRGVRAVDSNGRSSPRDSKGGDRFDPDVGRRETIQIRTNLEETTPSPSDKESSGFRSTPIKKLYQRTRFAADIPPPPQPRHPPPKQKSKFGDGFRKLMEKFRSASTERKNKKRSRSNDSRSPSPKENTYQNYNSLDNYGSLMNRSDVDDHEDDTRDSEDPVPPPRSRNMLRPQRGIRTPEKWVQRYYLGEDPFSGSIYGREREYDYSPTRGGERKRGGTESEEENDFKATTLGRLSKSTSRLLTTENSLGTHSPIGGGSQTLPRKLREDKIINNKNVQKVSKGGDFYAPRRHWKSYSVDEPDTREPMTHARSLINVSIVNRSGSPNRGPVTGLRTQSRIPVQGPAKPARTYRTNLSRSQSFNVQPYQKTPIHAYKSNSQLHGLEESQAPLESPSMIYRWSRNENRFQETPGSRTATPEIHSRFPGLADDVSRITLNSPPRKTAQQRHNINYSDSFRSTSTVNTNDSSSMVDGHLQSHRFRSNRPQVFTRTFHDGNVTKTVSRSESSGKDDYSETVRIESRSDDPLNPSKTNTVQIFTKKKIPTKGGHAFETIESRETKTVVKSQGLRNGALDNDNRLYNSSPSGVVIKVRAGKP